MIIQFIYLYFLQTNKFEHVQFIKKIKLKKTPYNLWQYNEEDVSATQQVSLSYEIMWVHVQ